MSIKNHLVHHVPDYYIAGVYIYQTDVWVGEFYATENELIGYGIEADLDGPEMVLVSDMIECINVYQDWWNRVQQK
jgi:hypothetical protein